MEKQDKLEILPLEVRRAPPSKSPTVTTRLAGPCIQRLLLN